jgi:hypothetical protein
MKKYLAYYYDDNGYIFYWTAIAGAQYTRNRNDARVLETREAVITAKINGFKLCSVRTFLPQHIEKECRHIYGDNDFPDDVCLIDPY